MQLFEHKFLAVALKYGDWPRVLDPAFSPPPEFYTDLEAAGYSREEFDRLRADRECPEREAWIRFIATEFYWERRRLFEKLHRAPRADVLKRIAWLEDAIRKHFEALMDRHSITADEIEQLILEDTDFFPPWPDAPENKT
jgi:hypothetical protein